MDDPVHIEMAGKARNQGMRTALGLAALTGRHLTCDGLVGDQMKPAPGLGPGGLTAAWAAKVVSGGRLEGQEEDTELELWPEEIRAGDFAFDVAERMPSAAPFSPVLETVLLPLSAAPGPSSLYLNGGTHIMGGHTSDELRHVLAPNWRSLGLSVEYTEIAPGFYPAGGGEGVARIEPCQGLKALELEKPFFLQHGVNVEVLSTGLPVHLAEQALESAKDRLKLHNIESRGRIRKARGGRGLAMLIWTQGSKLRVGFSALGRRGGRPEALAVPAVEQLITFLQAGAGLSANVAAALIPILACAKGVSRFTVDHFSGGLKAQAQAVNEFFPNAVRMDQRRPGNPVEVRIAGMGIL